MISHGQAASGGTGTKASAGSDTMPAAAAISTMARNGSSLNLISAFQDAWKAAASSTTPKTKGSIAAVYGVRAAAR